MRIGASPDQTASIRARLLALEGGDRFELIDRPPFILVMFRGKTYPDQGWKIHVSATPRTATTVFTACWPILAQAQVPFKFVEPRELWDMNSVYAARSQVGKFITVYPQNDDEAVALASQLHAATAGMVGPRIPSDRPLAPGSLVHYRYGGFRGKSVLDQEGDMVEVILDPAGTPVPDKRHPWFQVPPWVSDPFVAAGVTCPEEVEAGPIGQRYRVTSALKQAARGGVYLGEEINVTPAREILIKEGRAHIEVDRDLSAQDEPRDVRTLLAHEYAILRRMAGTGWVPAAYDLFVQGGNTYVVREYIKGSSIRPLLKEMPVPGRSALLLRRVMDWAVQLAEMCCDFHAAGLAIYDLTPNNILVTAEDQIRMIDLELVWPLDGSGGRPVEMATPGYVSLSERAPSVAGDVYAFGATLFFLLTKEDPYLLDDPAPLLSRQLAVLDHCCPELPAGLRAVVERCLQPAPAERFLTARALADAVLAVRDRLTLTSLTLSGGRALAAAPLDEAMCAKMLRLAREAGDELVRTITPQDRLHCWAYQQNIPAVDPINVQYGTSGAALLLVDLYERTGEPRYLQAAAQAAEWVYERVRRSQQGIVGLHFGHGGAAWFFLRLGLATGDERYLQWAAEVTGQVLQWPMPFVDITHGAAGIVLLLLALARATNDPQYQQQATRLGDSMLARAMPGRAGWLWGGLGKQQSLGFAHGVAGIGYCLLELGRATGDGRFTNGAEQALSELLATPYSTDSDGAGWNWPRFTGSDRNMIFWCNGAPGVGQFLIEGYRTFGRSEYLTAARRAAVATWERSTTDTLAQCHGIAGNAEFLLDMYRATGEQLYLQQTVSLAAGVELRSYQAPSGVRLWMVEGLPGNASYMTGYAGTASFLLRLSAPRPYRREWSLPIARLVPAQ